MLHEHLIECCSTQNLRILNRSTCETSDWLCILVLGSEEISLRGAVLQVQLQAVPIDSIAYFLLKFKLKLVVRLAVL